MYRFESYLGSPGDRCPELSSRFVLPITWGATYTPPRVDGADDTESLGRDERLGLFRVVGRGFTAIEFPPSRTLSLLTRAAFSCVRSIRNSLRSRWAVNRRVVPVNRRRETQGKLLTGGSPETHKHAAVSGGSVGVEWVHGD